MLALPPPSTKQSNPISLNHVAISKQPKNQISLESETPNPGFKYPIKQPTLKQPHLQRTNPIIWCTSILCLIFSLTLIFSGITTLIIFFTIKPRNPIFDIPNANLNVIYFDSPDFFNESIVISLSLLISPTPIRKLMWDLSFWTLTFSSLTCSYQLRLSWLLLREGKTGWN